jgi:hypothetical protein
MQKRKRLFGQIVIGGLRPRYLLLGIVDCRLSRAEVDRSGAPVVVGTAPSVAAGRPEVVLALLELVLGWLVGS